MWTKQLLESCLPVCNDRANTPEAQARDMLDKTSKPLEFVTGLNQRVGGGLLRVSKLVDAEVIQACSVIIAALQEIENTVSNVICCVRER